MRKKFLPLIIIALFIPEPVFAVGGAFVTGCASGGPLATPMGVAAKTKMAASSVSEAVLQVGKSIKGSQKKVITSINKNFESQNAYLRDVLVALETDRQEMVNARMFGPNSGVYGADFSNSQMGNVITGLDAESDLAGKFRSSLDEHRENFGRSSHRKSYLQTKDMEAVSSQYFFPEDGTLDMGQLKNAHFAIQSIVDPFPSIKLSENFQEQGEKTGYNERRKVKYNYLAMPAAVISDIVSSYAPVMELGPWAEKVHKAMGGSGSPKEVVNGKISPMAYIDMAVKSRFANTSWFSGKNGLHSKTPTGVMRDMAFMESVEMEMERRQMHYLQQVAGLMAQSQAQETGKRFNKVLSRLYGEVVR